MKTDSILTVNDFGNDELFQTSANGSSSTSGKSREKTHISHTKENGNLCLFCRDEANWAYPDEGDGYGDYGDSSEGYGDPYGGYGDSYGSYGDPYGSYGDGYGYGDSYGGSYGAPYDDEYGESYGYDNYDDTYGEYDDGDDYGDGDKEEGEDECDCENHDDELHYCKYDTDRTLRKPCDICGSPSCERVTRKRNRCRYDAFIRDEKYTYKDEEVMLKDMKEWSSKETDMMGQTKPRYMDYAEASGYKFLDGTYTVCVDKKSSAQGATHNIKLVDNTDGRKYAVYIPTGEIVTEILSYTFRL